MLFLFQTAILFTIIFPEIVKSPATTISSLFLSAIEFTFPFKPGIPKFLLPELEDQHFSYRIKEISDGEVHLLIYKD